MLHYDLGYHSLFRPARCPNRIDTIPLWMFDGKTAPEIEEFDSNTGFEELDLFEHLSHTRHVGVYAISPQVKREVNDLEAFHNKPI